MPKYQKSGIDPVYRAAEQFVSSALREDDSLFTPGRAIWSPSVIDDLYQRFVLQPDESQDTFEAKFFRQLSGAPPATVQLAAESLYVYFLVAAGMHGETKRKLINTVLSWSSEPVEIPSELDEALNIGIAKPGTAFHTQRSFQLGFLAEFVQAWKRPERDEQAQRLADPWKFKDFLFSLPIHHAYTQREALLHLVHPDTFERIVSQDSKKQIAAGFSHLVSEPAADVDRQLQQIRKRLAEEYGPNFDFYTEAAVLQQWRPESNDPWDDFITWGRRFYEWEGFDESERDYKLVVAGNLQRARDALFADADDWIDLLKRAFGAPNNLINWRFSDSFLKWCQSDPNQAAAALKTVWDPSASTRERIDSFLAFVPRNLRQTAGAAFFEITMDPLLFPSFRKTWVDKALPLTEYPRFQSAGAGSAGAEYEHFLEFLDKVLEEASARGLKLRDRLDAQCLAWCVTMHEPLSEWSAAEKRAFLIYRGDLAEQDEDEIAEDEPDNERDDRFGELAEHLLIDEGWLRQVQMLLADKRQVIFYGPPGTGKTYVGLELATHVAGSAERVELVQFHPSYAYEDFVEGYRPGEVGGQPHFRLVSGPLKRLATREQADQDNTYVLVIDEINRGNLTKVFGELYFLLEYRDRQIQLQYSAEPFALPANLWLIGTMNTADRSIALIDAALRRRFHFVPFYPTKDPIAGLLRRWLARHKPELVWVADVVDQANHRLNNDHAAIGPTHFMKPNLSPEWVERIWDYSILPYLAEQFFGEEERLDDFSLPALRTADGALIGEPDSVNEDRDAPADPA